MGRTRSLTLCVALILSLAAVASTACAERRAVSPSLKVAFNKELKKSILVDGRGFAFYLFTADSQGTNVYKPTCYNDRSICGTTPTTSGSETI